MSLAMMAMMADTKFGEIPKETKRKYEPIKEPKKVIPKGCNEYHFTKSGTQVSGTCTYIYFSCVASSRKVALKKFDKFNCKNQL